MPLAWPVWVEWGRLVESLGGWQGWASRMVGCWWVWVVWLALVRSCRLVCWLDWSLWMVSCPPELEQPVAVWCWRAPLVWRPGRLVWGRLVVLRMVRCRPVRGQLEWLSREALIGGWPWQQVVLHWPAPARRLGWPVFRARPDLSWWAGLMALLSRISVVSLRMMERAPVGQCLTSCRRVLFARPVLVVGWVSPGCFGLAVMWRRSAVWVGWLALVGWWPGLMVRCPVRRVVCLPGWGWLARAKWLPWVPSRVVW